MTLEHLKSIGFSVPPKTFAHRLILGVQARDKRGKTTFALGGTRPVIHIDTDIGTEGIIQRFLTDEDDVLHWEVDVSDRSGDDRERLARFSPLWEELLDKAHEAYGELQKAGQGTVVFDTASEMDQLSRLAHFGYSGRLQSGDERNFDVVNADWRRLQTAAYKASKINTIYVCHMRPVFQSRPTVWERTGVSKLENFVQALVQLDRDDEFDPPKFAATVLNCRQNINLLHHRLVDGPPREEGDLPFGVNFQALLKAVYG